METKVLFTNPNCKLCKNKMTLSAEAAKIYDRQIRLWGVDAQNRMLTTRLLVYGFRGLSAEVCKNVVLAGVGSVTIMDNHVLNYADLGANFFVEEKHVGKNRAEASFHRLQELNPMVKVSFEIGDIAEKQQSFFENFDIVFLTDCPLNEQIRVNEICRQRGSLFFAGDTFGLFAIVFQDLLSFEYKIKKKDAKEAIIKNVEYQSLQDVQMSDLKKVNRLSPIWLAMQLLYDYHRHTHRRPGLNDVNDLTNFKNNTFLKRHGLSSQNLSDEIIPVLCQNATAELNPVCAIVGGITAQEIIRAITRDSEPINNYLVYDGYYNFFAFNEKISK